MISECNGQAKTEREEDVCFDPYSASDPRGPEAEVLADTNRCFYPFSLCIRLFELFLPETNSVAVVFDSVFDAVLNVEWVVRVPWIVWCNRHDSLRQQVVVPIQYVELRVTNQPPWRIDGERVTRDAHRRLLVNFLCWRERRCDWNVVLGGQDTAAVAVVVLVCSVVVVPLSVVITLVDGNVRPIDAEELALAIMCSVLRNS